MPPKSAGKTKKTSKVGDDINQFDLDGAKFVHISCGCEEDNVKVIANLNCPILVFFDYCLKQINILVNQKLEKLRIEEDPEIVKANEAMITAYCDIQSKLTSLESIQKLDVFEDVNVALNCDQHHDKLAVELIKPFKTYYLGTIQEGKKVLFFKFAHSQDVSPEKLSHSNRPGSRNSRPDSRGK